MRAAVLSEIGGRFVTTEIADPMPKAREVLIRVAACGVCHTDLHVIKGEVPFPMPATLGHEVSGIVAALGDDVSGLAVGDRVVASFIMPCGSCRHCVRGLEDLCEVFFANNRLKGVLYDGTTRLFREDGSPVWMYSMGGLAELAVVPASAVFKIPAAMPLEAAAVLGCSVFTAMGAVRNVARLEAGESVAVVATGGVGMNLIQVAAAFGASRIVAVDVKPEKLALAQRLGATDVVDSSQVSAADRVHELTDGLGVDVAFEALGRPATVETAIRLVGDAGRVVMVGIAPVNETAALPITHVVRRKISILGSYGGRPSTDMPEVIRLAAAGKIDLDHLVTRQFALDEAGEAYDKLDRGEITGRALVTPSAG